MELSDSSNYNKSESDGSESTTSSLSILKIDELHIDCSKQVSTKMLDNEKENDFRDQHKFSEDPSTETNKPVAHSSVVFYDMEESYHNDTDIMITFTLKINPPEVNNGSTNEVSYSHLAYGRRIMGDRIGMFKVPFISPSDILAFEWVTETDCTNEGGIQEVGSVVFKKFDLPKEEDFFLFQYLRVTENAEQMILGASIPFHLAAPKKEDLKIQQSSGEFRYAKGTLNTKYDGEFSDVVKHGQVKKTCISEPFIQPSKQETKNLENSNSEKEEELDDCMSFIQIEEDDIIDKEEDECELDKMKTEFVNALQENKILEENLQKSLVCSTELQKNVDALQTKCQTKEQEIGVLQENQKRLIARVEDTRELLVVAIKSKEETATLLKSNIVRSDNLQKEVELLRNSLSGKDQLEVDIREISVALEGAQKELLNKEKNHEVIRENLNKEIERLKQDKYNEQVEVNLRQIALSNQLNSPKLSDAKKIEENVLTERNQGIFPESTLNPFSCNPTQQLKGENLEFLGKEIALKTHHGNYVVAEEEGKVHANSECESVVPGCEIFAVDCLGQNLIALKSCHGNYLVAEPNHDINARRQHRSGWETSFNVEILGDKKMALKTFDGLYVTADVNGRIRANSTVIGLWEIFEFQSNLSSPIEGAAKTPSMEQMRNEDAISKLMCPICEMEYENIPQNEIKLDRHINEHLEGLKCPICFIHFDTNSQQDYENHVNLHFDEAANDFAVVDVNQVLINEPM